MSIGFKKSLFGFNREDVINYIETAKINSVKRENELKAEVDSVRADLSTAQKETENIRTEYNRAVAELDELKIKKAEIDALSESIGKMYIVSQNSAKTVMNNALASSATASAEVNRNIETIENVHGTLDEIKMRIEETSKRFVAEISELNRSLEIAKSALADNENANQGALETFNSLFNKINNAE